jgi:hypothetical protein
VNEDLLKYPIGEFRRLSGPLGKDDRVKCIAEIEEAPAIVRSLVSGLSDAQLDTPYRPGGWTVRQVVHHLPDSHINAYVRFKLAVTEDNPTIRPYIEARWAELPDARIAPIGTSLDLLDALHQRWVRFLRSLSEEDFARTFFHPQMQKTVTLDQTLVIYSWHGRHHAEHIRRAL